MKQLDMVYLMKVIPHIRDMKDIQNIELINKKCGVAINSLKVNPWFTSEKDINKFCRIFNPPICNCNLLPVDETILMRVEKIKNYDIDNFLRTMEMFDEERMIEEGEEEIGITEKEKERIKKIIQKVETITCLSDIPEELIEILIENMQKGIKIRCGEVFSVLFERIIDKVKIKEEKYPSEIIIEGNTNGVWIKNIEKKNIRIIYDDIPEKVISNTPKKHHQMILIIIIYLILKLISMILLMRRKEKKIHNILNDLYANCISFIEPLQKTFEENVQITNIELQELPKHIKYLCIRTKKTKLIINQQYVETLIIESDNPSIELLNTLHLKKLKIIGVNEIDERKRGKLQFGFKQKPKQEEQEKKEKDKLSFENTLPNLEVLQLIRCYNLNINTITNKIKSIEMIECEKCQISVKSDYLEKLNFNRNKEIEIKIITDKRSYNYIKECENFKLEIESNNEQNIEIIKGNNIEIKSPLNQLIIAESKEVSIKGNEKCNKLKVVESTINEIDIKPKKIILKRNEAYKRMSLKEAEEICIIRMKDSTFEEIFDKCKKLYIDECENCKFIIKKNEINKMKITGCKNTEITGKLDNLEEIVTIDNEGCTIPEIKKNIKEDREIIDMNNQKKDIEIETDKKHIIIRNGYDSRIKIKSDISSDVTIENSEDIIFEGEYEEYGNIQFNNCKNKEQKEYNEQEIKSRIRYAQSIIINKCENMKFDIDEVKELLEVVDSKVGIFVKPFPRDVKTNTIHIENSQLMSFSSFASCDKGIIINSNGINSISYCQEEVIMKRMKDVKFMLSEKLKKLEMEECSGINIDSDVKGKEVKMIKCHNMKIIDTSNSIQPIECDNVEVITEQQNGMGRGFGRFLAGGNIAMGGFGGEFLH
ncbi:hypothetical protein ENUP19_0198G0026 [Entamoeba nuttalli]|uniref:DNA double-strand break repair Rad50 ATPase n=1 Tax=Entamoeba nuttalli TaxID=412467 RepID=A0ABQ0DNM8_9EUKA